METSFEAFIKRITQRPLPNNPMARVRTLAKELAEGAVEGLWHIEFFTVGFSADELAVVGDGAPLMPEQTNLRRYFFERWVGYAQYPDLFLLARNGYLDIVRSDRFTATFVINKAAFDLVEEAEAADVFISYRRKDSSAFALLVLARLKAEGLNAFLDMTIQPGDNWQTHLKEQIQSRDYFVVLLGKSSLESEVMHQELLWALESGANIIPIWHSGFVYRSAEWAHVPPEIAHTLETTHTIRVLEESALAYNNAIVELLNRFGITP
jgi:hypothetical protein